MMYRGSGWHGRVFLSAMLRKFGYVAAAAVVAFFAAQCHAAQCVVVDGSGAVLAVSGGLESCSGFVLATVEEFHQSQGVFVPLTADEGGVIGASIFAAWAIAFGFRVIAKTIQETD